MKTNHQKLKEHFKSSTIPRMKEYFGYKTIIDINNCKILSTILRYDDMIPITQDELFKEIQESIEDNKLTPYEFLIKQRDIMDKMIKERGW